MVQTEPFAEPLFRWEVSLEEGSQRAERENKGLMAGWQQLRKRYPQSIWRWKQSFYE